MAAESTLLASLLFLTISPLLLPGVLSTTFTFVNKCDHTVWPGILSNAGVPALPTTGFALQNGESSTLTAPASWGGRFWGRTYCTEDPSTGKFSCLTGDCGSGKLECSGNGATPPATLAEFTLDGAGGLDFFDVSLVDGFNLPMLVVPQGGSGQNCTSTGCVADLNSACPTELRVASSDGSDGVACKSACEAFQQPEFCCNGAYSTPQTCKPSSYSEMFKSACPRAYSYAYDDSTSTFTCADADYTITFCPSPNTSQKSSSSSSTPDQTPATSNSPADSNSTMVYEGVKDTGISSSPPALLADRMVGGLVSVSVAVWLLRHLL